MFSFFILLRTESIVSYIQYDLVELAAFNPSERYGRTTFIGIRVPDTVPLNAAGHEEGLHGSHTFLSVLFGGHDEIRTVD